MSARKALLGYPAPGPNGKYSGILEILGVNYTAGTGQEITARELGLGGFDFAVCDGLSYSGTYFGRVQYGAIDAAPSENKGAATSIFIRWFKVADGLEATADLSTEMLRLFYIAV